MTTLRSLLFNIAFFGWTTLLCLTVLPAVLAVKKPGAIHWLARFWNRGTLAMLKVLCRVGHRVTGLEKVPSGPCIVAAKHQSVWETMIFGLLLDRPSFVLKRELAEIPLFGKAIKAFGNVVVDRSGGSKALRAMVADARRAMAAGRPIVIFPQGTRVKPGDYRGYHPGVAALYLGLAIPVVPVALNSGLFWGRHHFRKYPGTIQLEFLEPIEPGLDRRSFMAELERRIEDASTRLCTVSDGSSPTTSSVEGTVDKSVDKTVDV